MCDSKELLVGYLYDELDPTTRRTFEAHAATCADCRHEVAELRATRGQIAMWTPPEPDLGFRVIRGAAAPPPVRFRVAPAWGLAAAALLVMAVGAAIANFDVRYDAAGLSVRTGWQHGVASPTAAPQSAAAGLANVDWKAQAEALDRRLRDLERSVAARPQSLQSASATGASDDEVLQRLRDIVSQSETRQQRLVAARLAELTRNIDAQRKLDLAVIDQGMTRLQNTSGAEVKQYRDAIQRLYRATYQTK
jgi:anti-sigma factor RsiW